MTDPLDHIRIRAMRSCDRHGPISAAAAPDVWTRRPVRLASVLTLITVLAALGFVACAVAAYRGL